MSAEMSATDSHTKPIITHRGVAEEIMVIGYRLWVIDVEELLQMTDIICPVIPIRVSMISILCYP